MMSIQMKIAMQNDTISNLSDELEIKKITSSILQVKLKRVSSDTSSKAYWKIPIYCVATGEGDLEINVLGKNSRVSSSSHVFAKVFVESSIKLGHQFSEKNCEWLTIKEKFHNEFGLEDQIIRLELSASEWFESSNTRLGPESMLDNSILGGVEYGIIKSINRVSDKVIEITLNRGQKSSVDGMASWSIPLYHVVTEYGDVNITIRGLNSDISEGTFTKDPVKLDVTESIEKLRLQIGSTSLVTMEGQFKSSKELDVAPVNPSGTTLVPLRGILEALGAEVIWHGETQAIDINKADLKVTLTIGAEKLL